MRKLFVYADFDWLESPQLIGELSYDSVRGNDTYGFAFDKIWLVEHDGLFLSDDLNNYPVLNTRHRARRYLRVSPMRCPTVGVGRF